MKVLANFLTLSETFGFWRCCLTQNLHSVQYDSYKCAAVQIRRKREIIHQRLTIPLGRRQRLFETSHCSSSLSKTPHDYKADTSLKWTGTVVL